MLWVEPLEDFLFWAKPFASLALDDRFGAEKDSITDSLALLGCSATAATWDFVADNRYE
jgi:hypothetical protein